MLKVFLKNSELYMKPSDAVMKNQILVADGIELPVSEKSKINVTTSKNSISGCVSPIISYLNLSFLLLFDFLLHWATNC